MGLVFWFLGTLNAVPFFMLLFSPADSFKTLYQELHQSVKMYFVGSDLGPNTLQKLSADDNSWH